VHPFSQAGPATEPPCRDKARVTRQVDDGQRASLDPTQGVNNRVIDRARSGFAARKDGNNCLPAGCRCRSGTLDRLGAFQRGYAPIL
jgi:hypothetical protein